MKRLKRFCPVLPPALFQEQQASCRKVIDIFVCLMHGYIFLLYVYLLNKDGCWEIHHVFIHCISRTLNLIFLDLKVRDSFLSSTMYLCTF